jgi:glycyl-tRNA synthetase beta subunit
VREDKKGAVSISLSSTKRPGAAGGGEIVAEVLAEASSANFPWPKSMRWGSGSLRWVRPLHSILCMLSSDEAGAEVVPLRDGRSHAQAIPPKATGSWGRGRFNGDRGLRTTPPN